MISRLPTKIAFSTEKSVFGSMEHGLLPGQETMQRETLQEKKDCSIPRREDGSQIAQAVPENLARKRLFLLKADIFAQDSEGVLKQTGSQVNCQVGKRMLVLPGRNQHKLLC